MSKRKSKENTDDIKALRWIVVAIEDIREAVGPDKKHRLECARIALRHASNLLGDAIESLTPLK